MVIPLPLACEGSSIQFSCIEYSCHRLTDHFTVGGHTSTAVGRKSFRLVLCTKLVLLPIFAKAGNEDASKLIYCCVTEQEQGCFFFQYQLSSPCCEIMFSVSTRL